MKQFILIQEVLQSREQFFDVLQIYYDELQVRLGELQGEVVFREDMICFLQNEKIILEVVLQVVKSGKEEFNRGVRCLEEGIEEMLEILEKLREELVIKFGQVEYLQQEIVILKK